MEVNIVNGGIGSLDDVDNFDGLVSFGLIVFEVVVVIVFKDF